MMYANQYSSINQNFQVAITGLPVELRNLEPRNIYWVNIQTFPLCLTLLKQILEHSGEDNRGLLVSGRDPTQLIEQLALKSTPRDIRLFQMGNKIKPGLDNLVRTLDRQLKPKSRTIMLCLPTHLIVEEDQNYQTLFNHWQDWLKNNDCTLLVLAYYPDTDRLAKLLTPFNQALSGLASLTADDDDTCHYQIEHWRSSLKAMCAQTLELRLKNTGLYVAALPQMPIQTASTNDPGQMLFEKKALNGFSVNLRPSWQVFETREALVAAASIATDATVIFGLQSHDELSEIAATLHRLRTERGASLKLVLHELGLPLRHIDEQRILDSGATLVIPAATPIARFLSLLEEIQPLVYTRTLTTDPQRLFESQKEAKTSGIVSATELIQHLQALLDAPATTVQGILVCLQPAPGLSAQITLRELNLKRLDDAACTLDDKLYLFLYGCHPHLVDVALKSLFKIPYKELFTAHSELSTREEIEGELQRMRFKQDDIQSATLEATNAVTVNRIPPIELTEPTADQHHVTTRRYHPQRTVLALKAT